MKRKPYIAVLYNEPTVETPQGRRYFYEVDAEKRFGLSLGVSDPEFILDLSEVGVIEERMDVCNALEEIGYDTVSLNVDENVNRLVEFLEQEKPDLVFNLCESLGDHPVHEMHICSIYELLRVPYTGSSPLTLGLCLHKIKAKEILSYYGIPTPRFTQFLAPPVKQNSVLPVFPLIVKPVYQDASVGISNQSVVRTWKALKERVEYIIEEYHQPAIVEEYIDGREINVAILGNDQPEVLPLSEIDFSTLPNGFPHIVTYNAKWMKGTIEFKSTIPKCPAPLPLTVERKIKELALGAYQTLGCRDYARVDIRLDKKLHPFVIEVNPNPDLSDESGFARSARAVGLDYHKLIQRIVEIALTRIGKHKTNV